ncbi:ER lumen protein-retaining receptor 3 [Boothiomyces sp. JEL0838]|nr:ER lumen protein-retaining receptor 3 [Boothiomyces sp. JEL0838]KAJ3310781.1 ER lumen protein-retaining receptor 3 [Boothiomyces sp. JEL0838]
MNIFQLIADLTHVASICILLLKMITTRSASGISFKSQLLFCLVFIFRYIDLFTHFVSLYNTVMKIIYISTSIYTLFLMKTSLKATWDPKLDTVRLEFLIIPCALLACFVHYNGSSIMEITWAFSIYLEAVAILPQLFQLSRTGEAETITAHYLFALGAYRACYILNWIYKYFTKPHFHDWIAVVAGIIQTGLYVDFFFVYFTRVVKGKRFRLPA